MILREDTRKEYVPSNGEKGILLLGKRLSDEADYYLLDEPETGMSNSFIATVILPKIYELAKSGKTVVMVTHNANLAVRTLPYCSIYREHITADDYRTFVGNPFVNELVDVKDQESKLSWSEMSIRALEGGHDAFYGRKSVYEAGGINGCN